jgi:hypothetical protein
VAWAAGVGSETSHLSGALSFQTDSNSSNPGIHFAAIVLIGPAAIKLTLMFLGPRSLAK